MLGIQALHTLFQCNHIYLYASTWLTSHRLMSSGFIQIAAYVYVPASSSLDNISLHVDATFHLWRHLSVEPWSNAKFRYGKQCRECEDNAISEHLAVSSAVYLLRGIAGQRSSPVLTAILSSTGSSCCSSVFRKLIWDTTFPAVWREVPHKKTSCREMGSSTWVTWVLSHVDLLLNIC